MSSDGGPTGVEPGHLVAGRYRLTSRIGSGGMGAVWVAVDEVLGRRVAVKQVLTSSSAPPQEVADQRERTLREGRIAARLAHPHAIAIYDVALDGGAPWLVMEHLPSLDLAAVLRERRVLEPGEVAQIGAQVADALAAAHAVGVVHRDVKPANVLIGRGEGHDGVVKIADFGISRAHGDVTVTRTGVITGTPAYFAPEVARGEQAAPPSDVFSLAATLFAAVEGVPPFGLDDNAIALLHRVARGEVARPVRAGALTGVLLRMLEPDPARRPTMAQARDELADVAAGGRGTVTEVLSAPTTVLRGLRPAAVLGGAVLAGGAVGAAAGRAGAATTTLAGTTALPPAPTGPPAAGTSWWRRPVTAAAAALFVVAAVAAYLLTSGSDETAGTTAQAAAVTTTAPTTTPATTAPTAPTTTAAPTTAPSTTTTAPSTAAAAEPATPQDAADAVSRYFGLLPDDPEGAFALSGPTLRAQGADAFATFWSQYPSLEVGSVRATSATTVQVRLTYGLDGGGTQTEQHTITLIPGEGGALLVDVDQFDRVVGQEAARGVGPSRTPGPRGSAAPGPRDDEG